MNNVKHPRTIPCMHMHTHIYRLHFWGSTCDIFSFIAGICANVSTKDRTVNIFCFACETVSVTTAQLCHWLVCVPIKLYLQKQLVGMTLSLQQPHGDSLEAEHPLWGPKRRSSVPLNPGGQTCSCLSISPEPTFRGMVWNAAHSPVTQPPV